MKSCISFRRELRSRRYARATSFSLMFVHPTRLWKWKNNIGSSKIHPEKIMKIINFSVTTVANWMVYFYYMKPNVINSNCSYLMHPERNTFIHPTVHATQPSSFCHRLYLFRIFNSLWLKENESRFYYVDVSPRTSSSKIKTYIHSDDVDSEHFPVTSQICF